MERVRGSDSRIRRKRQSNDLLIAAIALSKDLTLVTHNTREFGRINGLKYEDWE